ncbi:peptide MFS transporter [Prevotella pallens]|jgi:amino acid/peptide transporter|uniref:peptide MFS transporter n=2 Tax=Prevotella pallens TaxID=60133 RepID=UPI001CAFEA7A|nr:peptide MFS transporter [Prevotella pallens]MBF1472759.1 peptide MFS transporter [Prevotella pallens]MBF1475482.1 peptide MFS transporter [Prevotella pallens]MBF1517483.1 peptide MFS transporter [Prevotella pallens]
MFEGQPKSLYALALANTGERFGYYTMIAVFALFLRGNFGLEPGTAGAIYSTFLGLVYFLPLVGGIMADKFGYGKMVTTGIMIMFIGYLCLAIPLGTSTVAFSSMLAALLLISLGTGLFKGNLQVMVGNLYDAQGMESKRDSGFSIFYMAINIGALFAPTAAVKIHDWGVKSLHMDPNSAYHLAFAVACVSLILSIAIYYAFRPGFKHLEGSAKKKEEKVGTTTVEELSPAETKERIIALCLVFAVVIFFWMAFHQNGLTLTYFADEFVQPTAEGVQSMVFDVINLFMVIIIVYAGFTFFGAKTGKAKGISALVILAALAVIAYKYSCISGSVAVSAPIFQQFNPFYVVALTPVSMAIFGALARKGKEPSAPRKIAYGMLIAGCGFLVMLLASMGLNSPDAQKAAAEGAKTFASPNWLIGTYLVLTFGELLLSPMGISFVSKVAPPKYKGAMMGGWFVATALGNLLVSVGGFLWGKLPLTVVWSVFIILCVLSALFMFSVMKKLEKVAK